MVEVYEGRYQGFHRKTRLDTSHMRWVVKWQFTTLTMGIKAMRFYYDKLKIELLEKIDKGELLLDKKMVAHEALNILSKEVAGGKHNGANRELQFLYEKDKVLGVATQGHVVLTEEDVAEEVGKIVDNLGLSEETLFRNYPGSRIDVEIIDSPLGKVRVGAAISYGHELLMKAVRGSIFMEIQSCLNLLHFLELRKTRLWDWQALEVSYVRVLRVEKRTELNVRLESMVKELTRAGKKFLDAIVQKREVPLKISEARAIITAVKNAYTLGDKVTGAIVEKFLNSKQTVWDLAMAFTNAANDRQYFKSRGARSQARVSSAGTVLLAMNKTKLVKNCRKHIREKKLVRIPMKVKRATANRGK